ncbi:GPI mannosyltransferase 4-like, partial [Agrilus planipennis]
AEKAKFHKLKLLLPNFSFRNCFIVATITVVGFFNRPTFIAFAAGPVFFWLYRGMGSKPVISLHFNIRILIFALCTLPSFIFLIIFDSFYYGYISWGEIGMMDVSINSFVVTPLNFIKYNADNKNLAQHGLHPRYLHMLCNIPLLFNVLGFLAFYEILVALKRIYEARLNHLPQIKTIKALMTASTLIALAIFSVIPHQEARFLIPLLLPLVYLHGPSILKEPELAIIEKHENKKLNKSSPKKKKSSHSLLKIWIFTNLVCFIFFGLIHQGGVVQVPLSFNEMLKKPLTQYHLLTCYTYNIPYSLFLQKPRRSFSFTDFKEISYRKVYLHELGSVSYSTVAEALVHVHNHCLRSQGKYVQDCKFFVLWPTGLESFFLQTIENVINTKIRKVRLFYPHFSVEALEYFDMYCLDSLPPKECEKEMILPTYNYLIKFSQFFSLSLYEVTFAQDIEAE